jgi:hypothetical protein
MYSAVLCLVHCLTANRVDSEHGRYEKFNNKEPSRFLLHIFLDTDPLLPLEELITQVQIAYILGLADITSKLCTGTSSIITCTCSQTLFNIIQGL